MAMECPWCNGGETDSDYAPCHHCGGKYVVDDEDDSEPDAAELDRLDPNNSADPRSYDD
jgi:hypothetical protein